LSADIETLRKNQAFIKSIIPSIAESHYKKILQQDITAQALVTQNTRQEEDLDEDDFYGPNSKNIKNRSMVGLPNQSELIANEANASANSSSSGTLPK
jgi:hypothetical protein